MLTKPKKLSMHSGYSISNGFYEVEVKEDEESLGLIVDIFNNEGELIDTQTVWNDDESETECPNCGSTEHAWSNSSGEVQCDNCGYEETE